MEKTTENPGPATAVALNGAGAVAAAETLASDPAITPERHESGAAWIDAARRCSIYAGGNPPVFVASDDTESRAGTAAGLAMAGLRASGLETDRAPEDVGRQVRRFADHAAPFVVHAVTDATVDLFALAARPAAARSGGGVFVLHGRNPQQAADLALIAHRIAETGLLPGIHALDRTRVLERMEAVIPPDATLVHEYLGRPDDVVACPTEAQHERYGEKRRRIPQADPGETAGDTEMTGPLWGDGAGSLLAMADHAFAAFGKLTGRTSAAVEMHAMDGAELVLVGAGPRMTDAMALADRMRNAGGYRIGVINLLLLNPFPTEAVRRALRGRSAVIVLGDEPAAATSETGAHPLLDAIARALDHAEDDTETPALAGAIWGRPEEQGADALLDVLAESFPDLVTQPDDDEAPAETPSVTLRVEAPGPWSESLAARLASTLCRLAPLTVSGARTGRVTTVALAPAGAPARLGDGAADIIVASDPHFLRRLEPFAAAAPGGAVLVQTPFAAGADGDAPTDDVRATIRERNLHVVKVPSVGGSADEPNLLADRVSAAFEGALLAHTDLLARLGLEKIDWKSVLAGDALEPLRIRGAEQAETYDAGDDTGDDAGAAPPRVADDSDPRPRFPRGEPADREAADAFWREVFPFYRTGRGRGIGTTLHGADLYPALLAGFRDMAGVRYAYPLWAAAPANEAVPEPLVRPIEDLLRGAMEKAHPSESAARALKDNRVRLEQTIREALAGSDRTHPFRPTVEAAVRQMLDDLHLPGDEGEALTRDAQSLLEAMPADGVLIGYSPVAPLHLMRAVLAAVHAVRLERFRTEATRLLARLEDLLRVEAGKSIVDKKPAELASGFGVVGDLMNQEALTEILPQESASETMTDARTARITRAINALAAFEAGCSDEREGRLPAPIIDVPDAASCSVALGMFEGRMATMAEWFAAAHVARLELAGGYDASVHDAFFGAFDWRNFTPEELALAAPVMLAGDEERLGEVGLQALSRVLLSGRPVKVMILKQRSGAVGDSHSFRFRRELEHLAVAHPEVFVLKSSPVEADHLTQGLRRGLESPRPAIFHISTPESGTMRADPTNPYIKAGAALDSRDFPLFVYDPEAAASWGERFDLAGNPSPDSDWPEYELEIIDEGGQPATLKLAFTFADYAGQDPALFGQMRMIPRPFWSEAMTPLADYMRMTPDEAENLVPYVWMVDGDNVLQRVMPSHALVLACQDRINHWRVLQELSGIKNAHAERAAREAWEAARAETEDAVAAVKAEHAAEIERVRAETAGEAMEKLTRVLLDLDLDAAVGAESLAAPIAAAAPAPATPAAPATGEETPAAEEEDDDEPISDDPWLETFRCTSCNECIDINPLMFKYNADKLAEIVNPQAGTYADLVKAAEKCPARCIHPGKPLDAGEAGLEALVKRAEKFN